MAIFVPVIHLNYHDIGIVYRDADKKVSEGGAIFCMTNKETDNVPVNIENFRIASDMNLDFLILRNPTKNLSERIPMEKARILVESARQPAGADYKLVSFSSVKGYYDIPDQELPL
jgi:hypothetical protein